MCALCLAISHNSTSSEKSDICPAGAPQLHSNMQALIYYITLPIIYGISLLPWWVLFRISDVVFVLLYHVIGYRKKVVTTNLTNSFPEKSPKEIEQLQRKFYRFFCDLILEVVKSLTISPKQVRKHLQFTGLEVFERYYKQQQSLVVAMGHWGNWELGGARFAVEPLHQLNVIYHPLHNKRFDRLLYKMRSRLGNGLYPMKDTMRRMLADRDKVTATGFIADQTPSRKGAYWMDFLNQDTPVFTGTGRIAKKLNYPVVYAGVRRIKRGYYQIHLEELVPDPDAVSDTDILEAFTHRLEKDIRSQPEIWLWTHRRWKHKRHKS